MKVKVELVLNIDSDAWELNYGIPRGEQRADVKGYVSNLVVESLSELGLLEEE